VRLRLLQQLDEVILVGVHHLKMERKIETSIKRQTFHT
jgi:hypothetical protein